MTTNDTLLETSNNTLFIVVHVLNFKTANSKLSAFFKSLYEVRSTPSMLTTCLNCQICFPFVILLEEYILWRTFFSFFVLPSGTFAAVRTGLSSVFFKVSS